MLLFCDVIGWVVSSSEVTSSAGKPYTQGRIKWFHNLIISLHNNIQSSNKITSAESDMGESSNFSKS